MLDKELLDVAGKIVSATDDLARQLEGIEEAVTLMATRLAELQAVVERHEGEIAELDGLSQELVGGLKDVMDAHLKSIGKSFSDIEFDVREN